jgi:transposase
MDCTAKTRPVAKRGSPNGTLIVRKGEHDARSSAHAGVQVAGRPASTSGEQRPAPVCREYRLANGMLDRWRAEYRERGEQAFTPRPPDLDATAQQRIAALERLCGQLTVENALLRSAMSRWDNHDNENQVRDTPRTVVPNVECLPVPRARLKSGLRDASSNHDCCHRAR